MKIDPSTAFKLTWFGALTTIATAGNYFGLGPEVAGILAMMGSGYAADLAKEVAGDLLVTAADAAGQDVMARARGIQNRDVHRLMGEAIAAVLDREATGAPADDAACLRSVASAFRGPAWMQVELTVEEQAVGEPEVIRYFTGDPESIKSQPVLEVESWLALLERVGDAPITARTALRHASTSLRDQFATELWESAKTAWNKKEDVTWPALTLRLLSEICGYAKNAGAGQAALLTALRGVQAQMVTLDERIGRMIDERRAASAAGGSAEFTVIMSAVGEYRREIAASFAILIAGQEQIKNTLTDMAPVLDEARAAAIEARDHGATLAEQFQDVLLAARPRVGDNLAAAGATENPGFVGRQEKLDELSRLVDDPHGPAAVVVVAGAGFGKTELVREFVNVRAVPDAPGRSGWHARWWLDGSRHGEIKSLKAHFETITGRPMPPEPQVQAGEDAARSIAEWTEAVRRAVAQACSAGRSLLVVDNVETVEQIRQYRPANDGRLIATTRRQPIPAATGRTVALDEMSPPDARAVLVAERPDLRDLRHEPALTELAEHLGYHALALAYVSAALARPPHKSPAEILTRLQQGEVGEEAHLLTELDEEDLGSGYALPLAQSLSLLVDELADPNDPSHDALAVQLLDLASFCAPLAIPLEIFERGSRRPATEVERSLRKLDERSIVTVTQTVTMHRLTQSLVRGRLKRRHEEATARTLRTLLKALVEIHRWPSESEIHNVHVRAPLRTACWPHAEAVLRHVSSKARMLPPGIAAMGAHLEGELAWHLGDLGQHGTAHSHINAAISWGESQDPRDDLSLAINYAWRARIRYARGDLSGAEADIARSIEWGEAQVPRDEHALAIWYASRARIRQDGGDLAGAEADIARSIGWDEAQAPRDERGLAIRYASRARIRHARGELSTAEADIVRSIEWGEAQAPRDERSLAIRYASRAGIRQARGDLAGAEADIARSIRWGETQAHRDERGLAIGYASRAQIRRDRAIEARRSGDFEQAVRFCDAARGDIDRALAWYETNLPGDERSIGILREIRASIDAACEGDG